MLQENATVKQATKSARVQLLIRPFTKKCMKALAEKRGVSFNEYVNQLFEDHVKNSTF